MANPYAHHIAGTGGGNGSWIETTTNTTSVALPTMTALNTFTYTYNITSPNLANLSEWLWQWWTSLERFFTKADEAIISLHAVPLASSTVSKSGQNNTSYYISVGDSDTEIEGKLITKNVTLDCKTITLNEYSGSFLDYDSNTQISLYLPYIGTVQLDPAIVMNKEINIKYNIDLFTGNCVANVFVGDITSGGTTPPKSLMYTFNGNCAYEIPTSSINYSELILGAISTAAKVATALI